VIGQRGKGGGGVGEALDKAAWSKPTGGGRMEGGFLAIYDSSFCSTCQNLNSSSLMGFGWSRC
jgi:hypothetical protein